MPNFGNLKPSVCIDAVLEGLSIEEALDRVIASGMKAIEFWCWWEKDLSKVVDACLANEIEIAACCTKFISLVEPAKRTEYLDGLAESIEVAKQLNCWTLISQVGDFVSGQPRESQRQSLIDGLKVAAPLLEASGITLVIEPLNELVDHAGYFLIRSDEAFEIVEEVDCSNIKVVFDIYHQQISEGNLIPNIVSNIQKIGHFHAAGNPGRHELSRGEINYPEVFSAISKAGHDGFIGLEYWPIDDPVIGLTQVAQWLND